MTNSEFEAEARELGFERTVFIEYSGETLVMLLMPCPGGDSKGEAVISGYYPVSNLAYQNAKQLAGRLRALGYRAESNIDARLKPLLLSSGTGDMGRNSLVAVEGLGTRFHIQTILTDCPFSASPALHREPALAERCRNCMRCVNACPTGAIMPGMVIDSGKCLRAVSEITPPPEKFRRLLKNRLLGCDICQDVCPANKGLDFGKAPVISLEDLLDGNIEQMKRLIGVNYARKRRLKIKAAVIAANLKRGDLLPRLQEMSLSDDENEREIALWAIKEILENFKDL